MDKLFFPVIVAGALAILGVVGIFSVDLDTGRVSHFPKAKYDLFGGTVASAYLLDVGAQDVPAGKELHTIRLTGELTGTNTPAYLNGWVFNFINSSQVGGDNADSTRVRAIIGQVTANGPGSVRGIHIHALANPGATGIINAVNFQASPVPTTRRASAVQIGSTGARGIADGFLFDQAQGSDFRYGINMAEMSARYTRAAIYLPLGETNGVMWANGTRLFVDTDGALKVKFPNGTIKVMASP